VLFLENKPEMYLIIILVISAVSLTLYLIYVVRLRYLLTKSLDKEREETEVIEANTFSSGENSFRKIKQMFLEDQIESQLTKIFFSGKIIRNLYIPTSSGKNSEIDLLVIHETGLYIIEAKNLSGYIEGDWSSEYLKIKYSSGKEYDMYNPIIQNSLHYDCLKSVLGINEKNSIKNIVILGEQVKYNISAYEKTRPNYANVFTVNNMVKEIKKIKEYSKIKKDATWVSQIYNNLTINTDISKDEKTEHINRIKSTHKLN
jgi:hypothetical protein